MTAVFLRNSLHKFCFHLLPKVLNRSPFGPLSVDRCGRAYLDPESGFPNSFYWKSLLWKWRVFGEGGGGSEVVEERTIGHAQISVGSFENGDPEEIWKNNHSIVERLP